MLALDADPLRCFDRETSDAMVAEVDAAHKEGETLGGVVEVLAYGLPPGLGSYVHWDRRLDSRLAAALMGIQAIKGVEVGDGFLTAARRGSAAHDEIVKDADGRIIRTSNRAGGIEGGMSIGDVLRVRAAMKPIATVPRALKTVDVSTGEAAKAHHQRSDVCAVPAAGVVAEAMVALVLAEAVTESSAATPWPRPPATSRVTWTTFRRPWTRSATSAGRDSLPGTACAGRRPAHRPDRAHGRGQVGDRQPARPAAGRCRSWTPTPLIVAKPRHHRATSSPAAASTPSARSKPGPWPRSSERPEASPP